MRPRKTIAYSFLAATLVGLSPLPAGTLAEALALLNEKDGALRAKPILEKLVAEGPSESEREKNQFYLAGCEYQLGNTKNAFWIFDHLARGASSEKLRVAALLRLAMLQMEQGLDSEALLSYEALARQFPGSNHAPMAMMVQANYWLLIKGDKRRSLPIYEALVQKYPASEEAKLALSTLPGLRKMPNSEVRNASKKYVQAMNDAKQKKKS